jgi:hypothetical protein
MPRAGKKVKSKNSKVKIRTSRTAAQESLFQSFQWFDGLTTSGFILNRWAPFNLWISVGTFS